ncbi:hypothetical protein DITRI_Ditri15bG0040900 [Diplodiscus trichospermus]
MVLTGFRFSPTDEELLDILNQKVSGNTAMTPLDFIVESNIYELEPKDLQWTQSVALNKNERYYYCKRESDSREVSGRGWWKATSHVKTISVDDGRVVGYKRPLTFHRFRDNQRKRKDAIKTKWIMHEYALEFIPTEWRLCKIMYKGKEKLKEDVENIFNTNPMSSEAGVSSSSIDPMQLDFAFEEPLQPPLTTNNEYKNYFWSNSNMRMFDEQQQQQQLGFEQPSYSFDPGSSMSIPTPSYYHFDQQDNYYQQPFPDLWS